MFLLIFFFFLSVKIAKAEHSALLVEFYAPWCGHCKRLASEWETAATELKGVMSLAKVDATENKASAEENDVRGYPTIVYFENGVAEAYNGPRESDGIVAWAKKRLNPVPVVESADELAQLIEDNERVVVANIGADDADWGLYKALAVASDNVLYVASSASGVAAGQARLHTKLGEPLEFTEAFSIIHKFVSENAWPLLEEVTDGSTFQRLFQSGVGFALVWLKEDDSLDANVAALQAVADSYGRDYRFAWLREEKWGHILPRVGASGDVLPTAVAWSPPKEETAGDPPVVWDESAEFTVAKLGDWIEEVKAGAAKTWQKSEEIPESQESSVKVLVWKSWDEIGQKKTFVKFYAPWCGHCKTLAPIWEELADAYADDDSIVIAKYDATANHVPAELGVSGYPTLKLFVDGQPIDFSGARDLESLKAFVDAN
jgi:protein disulfide-isomerase A1